MRKKYTLLAATFSAIMASVGSTHAATVYIPEGSAGTVLLIDSTTGQVTDRLTGLPDIHGLGGSKDSRYLVAGSYSEVPEEDAMKVERPASITQDEHAAHHNRNAARNTATGMVSILTLIDKTDGSVARRLAVPGAVHHVAVSPDGRLALSTHPNADGVSVVDLSSLRLVGFIRTGQAPNYLVFSPNSMLAYVSNSSDGTVSEIDMTRSIVRRNIDAGEYPEHVVISPDGSTLYVANADAGQVTALNLEAGEIANTYDIGGEIHGLDLSDEGSILFVSGRGENKLAAINLTSGQIHIESLAPSPYHLTAIRGSNMLYVTSSDEPQVWIIDQASLKVIGTIAIEGEGHQMVVLP